MPSGSHKTISGSHSNGGSSSGSSEGRTGGGYHHSNGPRGFYFGGTHYIVRSKVEKIIMLLRLFIILSLIALVFSFIMFKSVDSELLKIYADNDYYKNMITYAKNNPDEDLIISGSVTDKFYNVNANKYYLTYSFTDDNGTSREGYTFSVYTLEQAQDIMTNKIIELAINKRPIDENTDSVPTDYLDIPLEQDGEFIKALQTRKITKSIMIVSAIVFIGTIILSIIIIFKNAIKTQDKNIQTTETSTQINNKTTNVEQTTPKTQRYCDYCGAEMSEDDKKCSSCGARQIKH